MNQRGFANFVDFSLTLLTINVKGMQSQKKRKKLYLWLKQTKADIIFLQETHSVLKNELIWRNEWGSYAFFAHGTTNSKGVAVLFKEKTGVLIEDSQKDSNGRFIWITVRHRNKKLHLLNLYSPNERKDQILFYDEIQTFIDKNRELKVPLFIGGDFNCVLNAKRDKMGGREPARIA